MPNLLPACLKIDVCFVFVTAFKTMCTRCRFPYVFYIVLRPQGIRKQMKTLRKRHRVHIVLMTVVLKGKMGTANDIQEQPLKYPGW